MERKVIWSPQLWPGSEYLHLVVDEQRILADGMVIGVNEEDPFSLCYTVECDPAWHVRSVSATSGTNEINLATEGYGFWTDAWGNPINVLDGCRDVDISVTPFTNTIPIRRLSLVEGASVEIMMAYISAPKLEVTPMLQRYTCLRTGDQGSVYEYVSVVSGFTAELFVDADGLVVNYPGVWKRVLLGAAKRNGGNGSGHLA